jgi:hypothetical protein
MSERPKNHLGLKLFGEVIELALARKRTEENLAAALTDIKRLEQKGSRLLGERILCSLPRPKPTSR